ncbi:Lar family restriction alleviation protein [Xenorhabdus sp. SGI240]|uniref:Lar family restriction alleviation protein n=1 Tax=Xenorhabdus sp. SGI240 TaxID=3158262 RepID=UPI0032B7C5F5
MADKLKPCLFCGSGDTEINSYSDDTWFFVQCTDCGACGPEEESSVTAVSVWNNASPPQSK